MQQIKLVVILQDDDAEIAAEILAGMNANPFLAVRLAHGDRADDLADTSIVLERRWQPQRLALNGSGATKGGVPDTIFSGNSSLRGFSRVGLLLAMLASVVFGGFGPAPLDAGSEVVRPLIAQPPSGSRAMRARFGRGSFRDLPRNAVDRRRAAMVAIPNKPTERDGARSARASPRIAVHHR